jgi:hypothetical protein
VTAPDRRRLRAADSDRQAAAERLRHALDEGRLDFLEYDDRLARAYRSVTYGDLDDLFADLPGQAPVAAPAPTVPAAPALASRARLERAARGMPTGLRVLWTIWLSVVAINLTVWVLVSVGNGRPDTFWPMWLLVPGAVLAAVTAAVRAARGAGNGSRGED